MTGRRRAINPDIAAALGEAAQKEQDRSRTPQQRKKAKSDRKRNRVTYDLLPELEAMVERIAKTEELSKSGTAALLLAYAVHEYHNQGLTFFGFHTPSRSPLHEFVVTDENVLAVAKGEKSLESRESEK